MKSIFLLPLFIMAVAANRYSSYSAPAQSPPMVSVSYSSYDSAPAPVQSAPVMQEFIKAAPAPAPAAVPAPAPVMNAQRLSAPLAAPSFSAKPVHQIVRLHQDIKEDDINAVSFDTNNGIRVQDQTKILPGTPNPENPSELWNKIAKSGSYSYTSPEGVPVSITWTADGINGFRAFGSVIPTPPPAA